MRPKAPRKYTNRCLLVSLSVVAIVCFLAVFIAERNLTYRGQPYFCTLVSPQFQVRFSEVLLSRLVCFVMGLVLASKGRLKVLGQHPSGVPEPIPLLMQNRPFRRRQ